LVDGTIGLTLGITTPLKEIDSRIAESLTGREDVPGDHGQAVSDRHSGLIEPSAAGDQAVLGGEVAASRALAPST
jgi:hypothetical protein